MAQNIDERERRRLNRERVVQEHEARQRLQNDIRQILLQRDQYVNELRRMQKSNVNNTNNK